MKKHGDYNEKYFNNAEKSSMFYAQCMHVAIIQLISIDVICNINSKF